MPFDKQKGMEVQHVGGHDFDLACNTSGHDITTANITVENFGIGVKSAMS